MDNGTSVHGNEYNSIKYCKTMGTLNKSYNWGIGL